MFLCCSVRLLSQITELDTKSVPSAQVYSTREIIANDERTYNHKSSFILLRKSNTRNQLTTKVMCIAQLPVCYRCLFKQTDISKFLSTNIEAQSLKKRRDLLRIPSNKKRTTPPTIIAAATLFCL